MLTLVQIEVLAEAGVSPDPQSASSNKYKQILGIKELHLLSLFSLIYVGTEVTLGGWSVTYVQDKRNGGANAGYISSGFFAGLMLGRILLMWVNRKVWLGLLDPSPYLLFARVLTEYFFFADRRTSNPLRVCYPLDFVRIPLSLASSLPHAHLLDSR